MEIRPDIANLKIENEIEVVDPEEVENRRHNRS